MIMNHLNLKKLMGFALLMSTILSLSAQHQTPSAGLFTSWSDVGEPALKGRVSYHEPSQEYRLHGSGENIWFGKDQFSFLWKEMEGDFILQAELAFVGDGVNAHRKAGLMFRQGLGAAAPHVSCVIHGDGLTSLQYRSAAGKDMEEQSFALSGPTMLQLEKKGGRISMSVAHRGELYTTKDLEVPPALEGPLHAGLFICSHDASVMEEVRFSNVRLFGTAHDTLVPYRDYLGSVLEVMDVGSGLRQGIASSPGNWEAPNWTPDGKALIFNSGGLLYRFDLQERHPEVLNTDFASSNNNDHVISFDGKSLAISHHAEEDGGQSVIYTLPLEGGTPQRVTSHSPSYLHGWSPDGRFLVYTGGRDGAYNIFKIPVEGGEEVQLTHEESLDDGPEYSPDGRYIYFNSARTGRMEIWRMKPDGSEQTQITSDELNNWFPHISPDGRTMVFLSYGPEVEADKHPYYQRVYLRMMSLESLGKARVIAYLYGGQGTINVPSWSPDSKKIAFISHGL